MGFGSYDESEQESQETETDEDVEAVNVHENDTDGEVTFESEESTDELVDRLQNMKDN